jgi:hypothetical protein
LAAVRAKGCTSVHIGGGEPLLFPEDLGEVLDAAREAGVGIDYVETNGAWWRDHGEATEILGTLKARGLQALLLSVSPFHNEHIPLSKTKGVLQAAKTAGVQVIPWVADFFADLEQFDPQRSHGLEEYEEHFGAGYLRRVLGRYWIHFGGRALDTFRPLFPGKSVEELLASSGDCSRELKDTSHFHVDPFGSYIPGLCTGLAVDCRDLEAPLPEARYPLLNILHREGVAGLFRLARAEHGYAPRRERFLNACDLCTDIRDHLAGQGFTASQELAPEGFYVRCAGRKADIQKRGEQGLV